MQMLPRDHYFIRLLFRCFAYQNGPGLVGDILGEKCAAATEEVSTYLIEGVGNQTRIDYGTGRKIRYGIQKIYHSRGLVVRPKKNNLVFRATVLKTLGRVGCCF